MRLWSLLLVVVVPAFAGCTVPGEPDWADPQTSFTVASVSQARGSCAHMRMGDQAPAEPTCHTATVHVRNDMREEDLEVDPDDWTAVADSGAVWEAVSASGASAIAPGYTATLKLKFELDRGEKVDLVRFKHFFNDVHTTAPAPDY